MAINIIEYVVGINGITPNTEQAGGTQGDHRVTGLSFTVSSDLYSQLTTAVENGTAMYRFDIYDGEGGIWQSEPQELESTLVNIELEERHTRFGGKVVVYLVITALSTDQETEIELYSFPAMLRLKNKPQGVYQEGENYESVTGLVEVVKSNVASAAASALTAEEWAQNAEGIVKQAAVDVIDRASSEADRAEAAANTAAESISLAADEVVKAEQAVLDAKSQVDLAAQYAESMDNAIADAVYDCIPRKELSSYGAPFSSVIAVDNCDIKGTDENTGNFEIQPSDSSYHYIDVIEKGIMGEETQSYRNTIPIRDTNGNLFTGTPVDDLDCANKNYVDNAVKNIDTSGIDVSGKVDKVSRSSVTDPMAYEHAQESVPYLYGRYGAPQSDGTYVETEGLIKASIGGIKYAIKEQIALDLESGAIDSDTAKTYLAQVDQSIIPSAYNYMLDIHTIPIRDGNCAIPVGIHKYDEDENGNIINSKIYYGGAVPEGYMMAYVSEQLRNLNIKSGTNYGLYQESEKDDTAVTLSFTDLPIDDKTDIAKNYDRTVTGKTGVALGSSVASGSRSFAAGSSNVAAGDKSVALGCDNYVSGYQGFATGYANYSSGDNAVAMGAECKAVGLCDFAIGTQCIASGNASSAMGTGAQATGTYSHARGNQTRAGYENQFVVGKFNANSSDTFFEVGNGTDENNRSTPFAVLKSGNAIRIGGTTLTEEQLVKLLALIG